MSVTIIGIGPGHIDHLSLGAYKELTSGKKIYCRTKEHPVIDTLLDMGIEFEFLDEFYMKCEDFDTVYEKISEFILECSKREDIIYCVPGHPYVAETTVSILEEKLIAQEIKYRVISSMSFVDAMFQYLKLDPVDGFTLVNAMDFDQKKIDSTKNLILTQVYSPWIASDVKLKLMEIYGDEFEIWIVEGALIPNIEKKRKLPLYELDQINWEFNYLTSLYVPLQKTGEHHNFYDLINLVESIRNEKSDGWDKSQIYHILEKYLSEKSDCEIDAFHNGDIDCLIEELGDIMLTLILCSYNGKEQGFFELSEVIDVLYNNVIREHSNL